MTGCGDLRPVNPGARCEIYDGLTTEGMRTIAHLGDSASAGGIWTPCQDGVERIYLRGQVSPAGFVLAHELEHHAEAALAAAGDEAGRRVLRHAFRQLMSPTFEVGNADLLQEIP